MPGERAYLIMKIVLTGPKCSGKSQTGKAFARNLSLPFFETDELIEKLFEKEKGKKLSCRTICAEYGEDFFRDCERRVINQISKNDFCVVSTGGSSLLNKESRELLRKDSILVLLYASTSVLLERLSKKEIPAYLNDKTAKDLFAIRANLVIESLKPFAGIAIDSSDMDLNETLDVLASSLGNEPELSIIKKISFQNSALICLGQSEARDFLFSVNEKLLTKPGLECGRIESCGLPGISFKNEEFISRGKSWIKLISARVDKTLPEQIINIHKKYLNKTVKNEAEALSDFILGMLARSILEKAGIKVKAEFNCAKTKKGTRNLLVDVKTPAKYSKMLQNVYPAISMFFLSFVSLKFDSDLNNQQTSRKTAAISFSLISPLPKEEKALSEILNAYCSLVTFGILINSSKR